jgi:hypothetical protein
LRRMRWAGHVARMEERRGAYGVLLGNPNIKSPLGRPKLKWENIKMHLKDSFGRARTWIDLAQYRGG